jgi:DNA mismatch repair protein MutS
VPHHSFEPYLNKLIEKGYKVAVCDQVEDPKAAKGVVRREVTRVVTPRPLLVLPAERGTSRADGEFYPFRYFLRFSELPRNFSGYCR